MTAGFHQASGRRKLRRAWFQAVTRQSHALALERGVFVRRPRRMALSLKRSAERSKTRKPSRFRSARSMLDFYENRAGRKLAAARRRIMRRAPGLRRAAR